MYLYAGMQLQKVNIHPVDTYAKQNTVFKYSCVYVPPLDSMNLFEPMTLYGLQVFRQEFCWIGELHFMPIG